MTNKLDIMSVVAMFDAIDTNGISIGRVACATSKREKVERNEFNG